MNAFEWFPIFIHETAIIQSCMLENKLIFSFSLHSTKNSCGKRQLGLMIHCKHSNGNLSPSILFTKMFWHFSLILFSFHHLKWLRTVSKFRWKLPFTSRTRTAPTTTSLWRYRNRWTTIYNEGSFIQSGGWRHNRSAMQSKKFRIICFAMETWCSGVDCTKFNGH